jgi:hypothetical protein
LGPDWCTVEKVSNESNLTGARVTLKASALDYGGILKCVLNGVSINNKSITLTKQYAIPYSTKRNYYIDGASTIMYSAMGTNP